MNNDIHLTVVLQLSVPQAIGESADRGKEQAPVWHSLSRESCSGLRAQACVDEYRPGAHGDCRGDVTRCVSYDDGGGERAAEFASRLLVHSRGRLATSAAVGGLVRAQETDVDPAAGPAYVVKDALVKVDHTVGSEQSTRY